MIYKAMKKVRKGEDLIGTILLYHPIKDELNINFASKILNVIKHVAFYCRITKAVIVHI